MKLNKFLMFIGFLSFMFDPLAAHLENIEQSHFIDQLGDIIGIMDNILPDLTFLDIFLGVFCFPFGLSLLLLLVSLFIDFHQLVLLWVIKYFLHL